MAEYGSMFLVSGLAAILFLGGWNGPIPIADMIFGGEGASEISLYIANLFGCVNFILKAVVGVTVMIWIRWTLPRIRIDQVITICLKYCVPLAAVCFLGAVFWRLGGLPSPSDLVPVTESGRAGVHERWAMEPTEGQGQEPENTTRTGVGTDDPDLSQSRFRPRQEG